MEGPMNTMFQLADWRMEVGIGPSKHCDTIRSMQTPVSYSHALMTLRSQYGGHTCCCGLFGCVFCEQIQAGNFCHNTLCD